MARVLVTGGSGSFGRACVRHLVQAGANGGPIDAYDTDVRPLLMQFRERLDVRADLLRAFNESDERATRIAELVGMAAN